MYGDKCHFRHVEAEGKPNKRSKEGGTKGSVVCLKILIRENLVYVKRENWDQDTPSNSPKAPGTKSKIGKERVHRKELFKSVSLKNAILVRQIQGEVTRGNLATRTMRPRSSTGLVEQFLQAPECGHSYALLFY